MLVAAASAQAGAAAPQPVPTLAAAPATAGAAAALDGTIQSVRQATVAAQMPGSVLSLRVKAGDRVRAGQVLATLDERDAAAAVLRSEAGVAAAQAQWQQARAALERTRELRSQGFVSAAALDVATMQADAAQAALREAQAGRTQAAVARGHAQVTAPFDGIVLATLVEAGDLAMPGRSLVTLYAPGALRAVVPLPASLAAAARAAAELQVLLPDGRSLPVAQHAVLPSTDPVSQTQEWRIELAPSAASGDAAPRPGQAVRVQFASAVAAATGGTAMVLPAAALLRRGELTAVYVAQDGRFVLRAVRPGADRGRAGVEVVAGLRPGERVAADALRAGLDGAVPAP